MRHLFLFAIIPFLFSCGKKADKGGFSDEIKLSIDTVMVDAGEEFLSLNYDLNFSSLSPDKSYLINLNPETHVAEKIDLNNLVLSEKIQFEKEGPNGVGQRTVYFSILPDDRLLFRNYMFYKVFDQKAQLTEDLELEKIAPEYLGDSERYALQVFQSNDDPNRVIVFGLKWENYTYFILDMDLENRTYTAKDLPVFEKGKEFRTNILYNGSPAGGYGPSIYSTIENGKIYFNMNAFNEIHIFDLESDSLSTEGWDTPLLGAKRTYIPPKEVEMTTGELKEITRKAGEDVSYKHFVWDESKKRFYRFSIKQKFGEEIDEYDEYVAIGADVFLSVFDEDLNLVSEQLVPELKELSNKYFVKDGAIWMYSNVDDELAFTRINFVD